MKKDMLSEAQKDQINREKNLIIWDNIWKESRARGWSQAELARQMKIGDQDIRKLKNGQGIGPNLFARFCYVLNVKPAKLLGNDHELLKENRKLSNELNESRKKSLEYLETIRALENHFYSYQRSADDQTLDLHRLRKFPIKLKLIK